MKEETGQAQKPLSAVKALIEMTIHNPNGTIRSTLRIQRI